MDGRNEGVGLLGRQGPLNAPSFIPGIVRRRQLGIARPVPDRAGFGEGAANRMGIRVFPGNAHGHVGHVVTVAVFSTPTKGPVVRLAAEDVSCLTLALS